MEAELVRELALARKPAFRRHERGERADDVVGAWSATLAHGDQLVGNGPYVGRPAIAQRLDGASRVLRFLRVVGRKMTGRQPEHVKGVLDRKWWHVNDFEAGRPIVQESERPGGVAAGENEAVLAGRQSVHEILEDGPEARETFEGAELEEFVQQERDRLAAASADVRKERERRVERRARASRGDRTGRERRGARDRVEEPFWSRRRAIDIDVLCVGSPNAIAQLLEQRRAPAAAATEQHGDA